MGNGGKVTNRGSVCDRERKNRKRQGVGGGGSQKRA